MYRLRFFLPIFVFLNFFKGYLPAQNLYFPPTIGSNWVSTAPATLGFCEERVDSLYQFLDATHTKGFLLLKDGKIVLEKYFDAFTQDSFWYWASAGKSLSGFLVGQAQDQGLLSINDATSEYLGDQWTTCPLVKESLITVKNQISMTTGLDDELPPTPTVPNPDNCLDPGCLQYKADAGTRWAYHNAPYHLVHEVLENASNKTIQQFTKQQVLDPTGMKGAWFDHIFYSRPRDMARFGLLTLARGVWNGDTLLHDSQYFYDMTHPSQSINKSYGYLWWLNGQGSLMLPGLQLILTTDLIPSAPDDLIAALGKNDQKIHVVPSKGWVVVRMGNASGASGSLGGAQVPINFDEALWIKLNALVCNPVAANEVSNLYEAIQVLNNPTTTDWEVIAPQSTDGVKVFSVGGALVGSYEGLGVGVISVPSAGLTPGIYFLRVATERGIVMKKVVRL